MKPWIENPMYVMAVLLAVLAVLFGLARHPVCGRIFKFVPLLIFVYFVPTFLSNVGVIPLQSPAYDFAKNWFLPGALILLTLSVDLPAVLGLGKKILILFLGGTASVILGGPLAYLILGKLIPQEISAEAWKGLGALSGAWIGGGANFLAVAEGIQTPQNILNMMVIVDVSVGYAWMAVLLVFANREAKMDHYLKADRTALDALRQKLANYHAEIARPTTLGDLLSIFAIAMGGTALCTALAKFFPDIGVIIRGFVWVVILVTLLGLLLSFTSLRKLEGAGSTAVGSAMLYLLIATIGAQGNFLSVLDAPAMVAIGCLWMFFHGFIMLLLTRWLRAPIFFTAVASMANIGAAASTPIVASAFHPALASVGVLLAVFGNVVGTYGGLLCSAILHRLSLFFN